MLEENFSILEIFLLFGFIIIDNVDIEIVVYYLVMVEIFEVLYVVYEDCKFDMLCW